MISKRANSVAMLPYRVATDFEARASDEFPDALLVSLFFALNGSKEYWEMRIFSVRVEMQG